MTSGVKSVLFLLFLGSGFCGLLYQIVWLRMAFACFGVVTQVLSVVISIFMLGLFVGSWTAGRFIDRLTRRSCISAIHFYAVAECLIAGGAWAVPRLFQVGEQTLLPAGETNSYAYLTWSAVVIAAAIFPWCFFMGTTFPLMSAFVKEQDRSNDTAFSFLYLANVIGAMLGTSISALVLIELLGFRGTLTVAAICNLLIGGTAFVVGLSHPRGSAPVLAVDSGPVERSVSTPATRRAGLLALILFATGFTSMAMEVVWTRAFTVVLRTQVYSFALLLFDYFLATWIGSLVYRWHLRKGRVLATAALIGMLGVAALLPLLINDQRLDLSWAGALGSIFPFCGLLGYLTPKLIDEYSHGRPEQVGVSYAVNISGCILGPLVASYVLLPAMSLKAVLLLLAAPYLLLIVYFTLQEEAALFPRLLYIGFTVVLPAMASFGIVTVEEPPYPFEVRRDHVAYVLSFGEGMRRQLLVNGVGMTGLTPITKIMAHFPLAELSEPPKSALIICFGMGTTWRSALSWGIDATAAELVPSVKDAFPYYYSDAAALLSRPNARIVIDDGRRFLRRTDRMFDLITLDPPPPVEAAGSSLLYSDEFYDAVKLRLRPNGILQQWLPIADEETRKAVTRSLLRSFPHVRMFDSLGKAGTHFLASRVPVPRRTARQLVERMPAAARKDFVEWFPRNDPADILAIILEMEMDPRSYVGSGVDRVTDDRPFNEYFLLRRLKGNSTPR